MTGITLDAGALIGFERNRRTVVAIIRRAVDAGATVTVPAGALGQVWRDGRRQVRLARLLGSPTVAVDSLDDARARAAGQLCGVRHTTHVIDASVVLCARARGQAVLTSDVDDLRRLDPSIALIRV